MLLGIFMLFLLNGIGALDINIKYGFDINFNPQILTYILSSAIRVPFSTHSLDFILIVVTGLLLSSTLPLLSPIYAAFTTLFICIPQIYLYTLTGNGQMIMPMEYSLIIILVLFSTNALISYFIETQSRQKIISVFGQYVPPEIVSELFAQPDAINMHGESRYMTVFFCDLKNFSQVAEKLNPKQLTLLLNEYFDSMTKILYQYAGTIDKYIGDSVMAFWGAPLIQNDHAERAVLAGFDMHKKIEQLSESFTSRGWPKPSMGIGINTGIMNVGNMGSSYRIAYTVIGDAVNIASRIESLTRKYKVPTLVSEATKNECKNIIFREIDTVQVKGKQKTTRIYQPLCRQTHLNEKVESLLERHHKGMEAYNNKDYILAHRTFVELQQDFVDDCYYPAILKIIDKRKGD
jgi:adenylate cyclase